MLIIGRDGQQYDVNSVNDLPPEARWDTQGELHHPQTEQALENATDSSTTRNNASEYSDGSSTNQAPNNAGSNTDPDAGKPDSKPQAGTAKPKKAKTRLNRNSNGAKVIKGKPKAKPNAGDAFLNSVQQAHKEKELNDAHKRRTASRDKKIQHLGRRGSVGALGLLGAVADGYFTYSGAREEDPNGSKAVDMAKAGAVAAGWVLAEPVMWALTIGGIGIEGGKALYEDANENYQKAKSQKLHITKDASGTNRGTLGGHMIDSEEAHTLRQRSEQVMRQHRIATESILGSEARQLHR